MCCLTDVSSLRGLFKQNPFDLKAGTEKEVKRIKTEWIKERERERDEA